MGSYSLIGNSLIVNKKRKAGAKDLGSEVLVLGSEVLGSKVLGSGFRVQELWAQGLGFRGSGFQWFSW